MTGKTIQVLNYRENEWEEVETEVIQEKAVTLSVNNTRWLTFMCTPVDLEALAIGFLYNEEIIQSMDDVVSVWVCPGKDNIDVWLNFHVNKPEQWIRTSGCSGGETSISNEGFHKGLPLAKNGAMIDAEAICSLISSLSDMQSLYKRSGGVHASAFSDGKKILVTAEDIGRHNTLDKIAGMCLLKCINPSKRIILTTGRISSEMIQKAGRINAAVVISRTSPTSMSVRMAEKLGITLIGYGRSKGFNVYTHPERILCDAVHGITVGEAK